MSVKAINHFLEDHANIRSLTVEENILFELIQYDVDCMIEIKRENSRKKECNNVIILKVFF